MFIMREFKVSNPRRLYWKHQEVPVILKIIGNSKYV